VSASLKNFVRHSKKNDRISASSIVFTVFGRLLRKNCQCHAEPSGPGWAVSDGQKFLLKKKRDLSRPVRACLEKNNRNEVVLDTS
jgi:hypothetical protein